MIRRTAALAALLLSVPAMGQKPTLDVKKRIPRVVEDSLVVAQKMAPEREQALQKVVEHERKRAEPLSKSLGAAVKASGVDLDGYLKASKEFVEDPSHKRAKELAESINGKYAGPIRDAIAKVAGLPGLGAVLQGTQSSNPGLPPVPPGPPPPPPPISCCTTQSVQPPYTGLYSERNGARAIDPFVTLTTLSADVRSAIIDAPHNLETTGHAITVPDNTCTVRVTVNLGTAWVIGLSGLGYAHVWLGLDTNVTRPAGGVVCTTPHLEQDNLWTWAGGFLTASDHRPGPDITRVCEFSRRPGDPTTYSVNVTNSVDGTFFGFSGGYGDYFLYLRPIDVTTCGC